MEHTPHNSIGSLVRARRLARRLTLEQLAALAACTKSYLSGIENDRRESPPSEWMLRKIEQALGFNPGELVEIAEWRSTPASVKRHITELQSRDSATRKLIGILTRASDATGAQPLPTSATSKNRASTLDDLFQSGDLKRLIDAITPSTKDIEHHRPVSGQTSSPAGGTTISAGSIQPLRSMLPVEIPLINSVAAGYPAEFTDLGYPARVADDYVRAPNITDPDAFAARVVGDSMLPEYREGDIVVFSPELAIKSGADCFVRLEPDHETTFKRVYFEPGANGDTDAMIRLQPLNPAYAPKTVPREEVAGLYAVAALIRMM